LGEALKALKGLWKERRVVMGEEVDEEDSL
jgi:hypothetical protein